jgi:E3 ubiquitin-protein ligase HUWE1
VEFDLSEFQPTTSEGSALLGLPNARSALLKHLLRSVHRMMHSSGTAEGLRGLIDSSLLKSVKLIMENRELFGPVVLPLAINVMTTFIHNEPTSLSIIQEQGLPQVFYEAIEGGLEPSIEVIQAVPNAIGALCLNQPGLEQLQQRSSAIPSFFAIFTSEAHVKILRDKDNAAVIGSAIDELIRHQPTLAGTVFTAISSTLDSIRDLGLQFEPKQEIAFLYRLHTPTTGEKGSTSTTEGDEPSSMRTSRPGTPMDEDDVTLGGLATSGKGNTILASFDVFNKVRKIRVPVKTSHVLVPIVPGRLIPTCTPCPGFCQQGRWTSAPQ